MDLEEAYQGLLQEPTLFSAVSSMSALWQGSRRCLAELS